MTDVERLADQAADILAKAREAALEPNARKTLRKFSLTEVAALVRETQMELMRKRSSEPKESLIDALINDEVQRLTSLR